MYFGSDKAKEDIKKAFEEHKGEPILTYSEEALRLSGLAEQFGQQQPKSKFTEFTKEHKDKEVYFDITLRNSKLFEHFAKEHNLVLIDSELDTIRCCVYENFASDLSSLSQKTLDDFFHSIIAEMNRRKAQEQKVDIGFWSSEGEYKEDIQTLTPEEASEIFPKANSLKSKIKELAVFHCGVCPQNTGSCDGCCVDYLREKSKAILEEFFGMEAK